MVRHVSPRSVVSTLAMGALFLVGIAACDAPQTNFNPVSDANIRIDSLYWLIIIAASLVGAGVLAALVYIMLRFRARPGVEAQQIHGSTKLEITWTLIPIVVLVIIAIPTVMGIASAASEPDDDALHVRAVGHQWWFEFEYPDIEVDGEPLTTANELYLPVGQQASISLEAEDVIHSFWVPQLLGKMDMVPNRVNRLEPFTPNEIGSYYGQCAEFCGLGHAQMRFRVHVVSLGEFNQWVEGMSTPPQEPVPDSVEAQGQNVFMGVGGCAACHTIEGTNAQGPIGPNLTLFGERTTLGAGILPNTPENLHAWIANVRDLKALPEQGSMPTFYTGDPDTDTLSEAQVAQVAAYLRSLRLD